MKQEASTYLGLSADGAAAERVGVADALEAANALGLLRFLNDRSLHTPGVHVSTELSKLSANFLHAQRRVSKAIFIHKVDNQTAHGRLCIVRGSDDAETVWTLYIPAWQPCGPWRPSSRPR